MPPGRGAGRAPRRRGPRPKPRWSRSPPQRRGCRYRARSMARRRRQWRQTPRPATLRPPLRVPAEATATPSGRSSRAKARGGSATAATRAPRHYPGAEERDQLFENGDPIIAQRRIANLPLEPMRARGNCNSTVSHQEFRRRSRRSGREVAIPRRRATTACCCCAFCAAISACSSPINCVRALSSFSVETSCCSCSTVGAVAGGCDAALCACAPSSGRKQSARNAIHDKIWRLIMIANLAAPHREAKNSRFSQSRAIL